MNLPLARLYKIAGLTKQAVYRFDERQRIYNEQFSKLWLAVDQLKSEHPGCGVEKMYYTLKPDLMGRDKFIEVFMSLGYRVRKMKNYHRTTIPTHIKYPNLIEGLVVSDLNTVWQSDITYYQLGNHYYYIVLITDIYSRKIVAYKLSTHMRAEANVEALKSALKQRDPPLIHHSDRGSQYTSKEYVEILKANNTSISMGMKAQDNAYIERVNGIIKNEYLKRKPIKTFNELQAELIKAVKHYNVRRKHRSLPNMATPVQFEEAYQKNLIEIIHAKNRPVTNDHTFIWKQYLKRKLICLINV